MTELRYFWVRIGHDMAVWEPAQVDGQRVYFMGVEEVGCLAECELGPECIMPSELASRTPN